MQHDFWQARWERNEIGFHQNQVNAALRQYWPSLDLPIGAQVLVPLCGKSLDMLWLAAQGYQVLGVELAERAVLDFFAEQGWTPEITQEGRLRRYCHGQVAILQGDFFDLGSEQLKDCAAFYDRAALIALPADMRQAYAAHLQRHLPATQKGLLLTLEYPQEEMAGPPFAVLAEEVERHFAKTWQVQELSRQLLPADTLKFLKRGASRLEDVVFLLQRS